MAMGRNMFHFITKNVTDEDKSLFFGVMGENDIFVDFDPDKWIMAHLLHHVGIFKSITQARKNGWDKPIPEGFNFFKVGSKAKKQTFYVLNIL